MGSDQSSLECYQAAEQGLIAAYNGVARLLQDGSTQQVRNLLAQSGGVCSRDSTLEKAGKSGMRITALDQEPPENQLDVFLLPEIDGQSSIALDVGSNRSHNHSLEFMWQAAEPDDVRVGWNRINGNEVRRPQEDPHSPLRVTSDDGLTVSVPARVSSAQRSWLKRLLTSEPIVEEAHTERVPCDILRIIVEKVARTFRAVEGLLRTDASELTAMTAHGGVTGNKPPPDRGTACG